MWKRKDLERERQRQLLGSHGAASKVRHIDPATYQPQQHHVDPRPPRQEPKSFALNHQAEKLLLRDAYHRHGKRHRDRVRKKIMDGRF